jgi:hypothetical protein
MAKYELVNNIEHKDLKVNTKRDESFGDNVWFTLTFPDEFRAIQAYYPIFFQKDHQTGRLSPVALMGFQQNDNLFLSEDGWDVSYIPATLARQPFAIGQQTEKETNESTRVLTIDVESPRVNKTEGEPLFLEYGGNSDYLERVAALMEAIHQGVSKNVHFIETLTACELIEPFTLDVQLNDGTKHQMVGFYTIDEDKLEQLNDEQLASLTKMGYLQAIYFVLASQGNLAHLIKRKNDQLGL